MNIKLFKTISFCALSLDICQWKCTLLHPYDADEINCGWHLWVHNATGTKLLIWKNAPFIDQEMSLQNRLTRRFGYGLRMVLIWLMRNQVHLRAKHNFMLRILPINPDIVLLKVFPWHDVTIIMCIYNHGHGKSSSGCEYIKCRHSSMLIFLFWYNYNSQDKTINFAISFNQIFVPSIYHT